MEETLAIKLRPKKLDDIIGQEHLIGKDKVLTNLVKNKKLFSMILYGKPGIGKTSIAEALANEFDMKFRFLNATINNKKDFDIVIEEAKMYGSLILIMDEIHRLNKDKQDLLLPQIESGRIILIGLTTSNPYHSINPAIRSRCHLFELHEITKENIITGLNKALLHLKNIKIDNEAINYIASLASGDLRYAYNLLEIAYYSSPKKTVSIDSIKNINSKPIFFHDKSDDGYYDVISAFQKSIRGSDVDAALHYLARLIMGGDLEILFRRLTVITYEDIGLSNPTMGPKVMAAIDACERVGLPEASLILANVVIELALSPKSNSAYLAIDSAIKDIENGSTGNVPNHIKTNSKDYKYPHNYPNAYVKQQYLPEQIKDRKYYIPKGNSKYESSLALLYKQIERMKQ